MKKYSIKPASFKDVLEIEQFLSTEYFPDTLYSKHLKYNKENALQYISAWINEICFIARDNKTNQIIGVLSGAMLYTYYEKPEFDIILLFIKKDYRGNGLSRDFVNFIKKSYDLHGIGAVYTSSGSGIEGKNNSLYANLFKKFGFKELGTELILIGDNNE